MEKPGTVESPEPQFWGVRDTWILNAHWPASLAKAKGYGFRERLSQNNKES